MILKEAVIAAEEKKPAGKLTTLGMAALIGVGLFLFFGVGTR